MGKLRLASLFIVCGVISSVCSATPEPIEKTKSVFVLGLGQASLNSEKAEEELIGDSATYIRLAWEGRRSSLLYGVGLSGLFFDDKAELNNASRTSLVMNQRQIPAQTQLGCLGRSAIATP